MDRSASAGSTEEFACYSGEARGGPSKIKRQQAVMEAPKPATGAPTFLFSPDQCCLIEPSVMFYSCGVQQVATEHLKSG